MSKLRKKDPAKSDWDWDIANLLSLISYFDSVRDGHFYTPKDLEERTKPIKESRKNLKYAQNMIDKTLMVVKSASGGLVLKIRINEIIVSICILYAASFAIFMTLFITGGIPSFINPLVSLILNPTSMTFVGLLLSIYIVLRGHIKNKIRIAAKQHVRRTRTDVRMKRVVQYYIDLVPRELRKKRIKATSKFQFELFYNDYEGIKTVKRPGIRSDAFSVEVVLQRDREVTKTPRRSR